MWSFQPERPLSAFVNGQVLSPLQMQMTLAFCLGAFSDLVAQLSARRGSGTSASLSGSVRPEIASTTASKQPHGPGVVAPATLALPQQHRRRVDARRLMSFACLQAFVLTPAIGTFYKHLEHAAEVFELTTTSRVLLSVGIDQGVMGPLIIATAFAWMGFVGQSQSGLHVRQKIQSSLWPTLKTGWLVWVPTQLINFGIVPLDQRVIVVNVVALFWNAFLAAQSAGSGGKDLS